jgi:hypothetical protein
VALLPDAAPFGNSRHRSDVCTSKGQSYGSDTHQEGGTVTSNSTGQNKSTTEPPADADPPIGIVVVTRRILGRGARRNAVAGA